MTEQCQLCGDPMTPVEGQDMHPDCADSFADYLVRAARGDCHCCIITADTRPGPNGGHWHKEYLQ